MTFSVSFIRHIVFPFLVLAVIGCPKPLLAQRWLTLRLADGITHYGLAGVRVTSLPDGAHVQSTSDGVALLRLGTQTRSIRIDYPGFQSKRITSLTPGTEDLTAKMFLFPFCLAPQVSTNDSLPESDSVAQLTWTQLQQHRSGQSYLLSRADYLETPSIQPGTDQDLGSLLGKINGVVALKDPRTFTDIRLLVGGISPRYNQLRVDQVALASSNQNNRTYDVATWPVELIESAALTRDGETGYAGDYSGGAVQITTRDAPVRNFISVKMSGSWSGNSTGKYFATDQKAWVENLGFLSRSHQLNSRFPTSRSRTTLSAKNEQEQSDLERTLPNTLAPSSMSSAPPGENVEVSFGRNVFLKKNLRLSLVGCLQQQSNWQTNSIKIQVFPDMGAMASGSGLIPVIRAQAADQQYQRSNVTGAFLNSNLYFGRNKISFKGVFRSQLTDVLNRQNNIYKPDEDTLAHAGFAYQIRQRQTLETQLSGEHGMGLSSRFKLHWLAAYRHEREQNPDSRNVLLRQPSVGVDEYQLAQPATTTNPSDEIPLTFSSREWRSVSDDAFTGQINLGIPFHLFQTPGWISGGVMLQTVNRELHDDVYLVSGTAAAPLQELFSPQSYYPGHLTVSNYYDNPDNVNVILPSNRGNYTASRNVAAAFLKAGGRSNKNIRWSAGLRMESSSQLGSATQYSYFTGFKYPRIIPLDQNTVPTQLLLLPSFSVLVPMPFHLDLGGSYVRSVNRPELQELVNYRQYDPVTFSVQSGNSLLQNAVVDNYRLSAGWEGERDNHIGLTAFYKKFVNAIENEISGLGPATAVVLFTPFNMPSAYVKGLSFSFRYRFHAAGAGSLLSYVSIFGEGDWLASSVSGGPLKSLSTPTTTAHSMIETPRQVYTGGVLLQFPQCPMFSLSLNHFSDYLSVVGSGVNYPITTGKMIQAMPGYRIKGRTNLDLQLSQLLFKGRCQLSGAIKNLLRPDFVEYQDLNGNGKFDTPLQVTNGAGSGGYYHSGIDNTVRSLKTQSSFVFSISYLFGK